MWISQPIRRVSSIILRINAKILDYSRFGNLRNNLNLYYDATPLFVAKIFVFHIKYFKNAIDRVKNIGKTVILDKKHSIYSPNQPKQVASSLTYSY